MVKFRMLPIGQRLGIPGYSFAEKNFTKKYRSDLVTAPSAILSKEQASHRMHEKPRRPGPY